MYDILYSTRTRNRISNKDWSQRMARMGKLTRHQEPENGTDIVQSAITPIIYIDLHFSLLSNPDLIQAILGLNHNQFDVLSKRFCHTIESTDETTNWQIVRASLVLWHLHTFTLLLACAPDGHLFYRSPPNIEGSAQASMSQTPMQIWKSHVNDPEFASKGQLLPLLNTIETVSTQRNKHEIE